LYPVPVTNTNDQAILDALYKNTTAFELRENQGPTLQQDIAAADPRQVEAETSLSSWQGSFWGDVGEAIRLIALPRSARG
jgi:hypothetical protein